MLLYPFIFGIIFMVMFVRKVLVSAFTIFNKASTNYSLEVINYLNNVDKVIVDVVYDKCFDYINERYNLKEYSLIIALGEARSRDVLTLEVNAKNISSCSLPDNSGVLRNNHVIVPGGTDILFTLVNVDLVKDIVLFSFDAGKYVCNNLYYHLLSNYPEKSLFIHVPNCHDLEEEYIKNAQIIEKIIEVLL